MAESTSQLQAKLNALTHGKVDIMIDDDTFKNTTQILREMSAVWEDMTDIEQASALELMGGKRQANILSSLISNFETVEDVITTSMESSGSAYEENAKWLDSIEGKTQQFSNAAQQFWLSLIDTETIKTLVDFGTTALKFLETLPGKIAAIAGALALFAKFKGFSLLGLGKEAIQNLNNVRTAYTTVQAMSATSAVSAAMPIAQVQAYGTAVSQLTAQQQANILASQGLSQAQIQLAMKHNGCSDAAIREALAHANVKQAQDQETLSNEQLIANKILLSAASLKLKGDTDSLAAAEYLEANASELAAAEDAKQMILASGLSDAQKAAALSAIGQSGANMTLAASFKALWASNPIGMILMIATTLISIGSMILPKLYKSAKEVREEFEELTNTYKETKKTLDDNLTTLTTSSDTDLYETLEDEFARLTKGVDEYGNNISLTSDQYERYKQICQQIVDINPDIAAGYDSATKAIGNNASALSQLIELQKQQQKQNVKDMLTPDNIATIATNTYNTIKDARQDRAKYNDTKLAISQGLATRFAYADVQEAYGINPRIPDTYAYGDATVTTDDIAKAMLQDFGMDDDAIDEALSKYYNDLGRFNSTWFAADYGDEIAKNSHLLPKQLQDWAKEFNNASSQVERENRKLTEAQDDLIDTFLQVPLGEDAYDKLNSFTKTSITEWIKNNDIFKIDTESIENDDELQAQLEDNIHIIEDLVNELGSESIQAVLDGIEDLDKTKISGREYSDEFHRAMVNIWNQIGAENNKYGFKNISDIEMLFGYDSSDELDKWGKAVKTIEGYLKSHGVEVDPTSLFNFQTMTQAEMEAFLGIDWNKIGSNNVKNIQDVWNLIRSEMGKQYEGAVKTYTALSEDISSYNDIWTQTTEVIANNTQVTQDYKDALVELGISEEELKKCFDENNALIVKDAVVLKDLVKNAKNVTAQNIKLAKSQAALKYYEKYKEMKKLIDAEEGMTAASRAQIKTLYSEMTALQKTMSRYSALEHQLLGATNAYEEFAKAQEIDEANDYESKAEEMVGSLVDAFQNGKLGAESAQAAIKGLVHPSVYEDLETLDEKMAAVYKYFTEDLSQYFYVKFNDDGSLESAEMLVDNVKKFVEDGINKWGVFTGSWEEWDLDDSITTMDDLVAKTGKTKEVIYAFLQAMETYDVSWIGGDASTLLDKLIPSTSEIQSVKQQIQDAFDDASFDVTTRLNVDSKAWEESGHTKYTRMLYSNAFGLRDENGETYQILATPVLPNGDILGEDEMADYIRSQLASGKSIEEVDIVVGTYSTIQEATEMQKTLDESIQHYQKLLKNYSLENAINTNIQKQADLEYKIATEQIGADEIVSADGVTTAAEQLKQLREEAAANTQAARDHITAWTEAKTAYDDASEAVEECNKELAKAQEANDPDKIEEATSNLEKAENTLWNTYAALAELGEPTEIVLTVAKESIDDEVESLKAKLTEEFKGYDLNDLIVFDPTTREYKVNYELVPDDHSASELERYVGLLNEQYTIDALMGEGVQTTLDVLTEIKDILSQTFELMVETQDAQDQAQSFADIWNSITSKGVTLTTTIAEKVKSAVNAVAGADVNGTAHVGGTAFAGGSWGASTTETALTGELGPEILVRNGRWTTVGENGAEFTQVKKGDIIFNHKQSEQLLKNGYVTGRGKAYASGTAYATGSVHPWLGGMGNIDDDWKNITPTLWNAATNSEYLADSAEEVAETFDWIEVRLEEINEQLDLMNAQLENAADYASKNNIIDSMIVGNNTKMQNLLAGIEKYSNYAAKLLADVPAQYRDAAQNGAIDITEFVGEADEATVKAISNYRDWAQKVADLRQQLEETKTELRDLYIQRIDNAQHSGDVRATVEASQTEKLQNAVDFDEARGLITNPNYYAAMMENSERTIAYLTTARDNMKKEFDKAVRDGVLTKGSDQWYEELDKLYQIDAEIDEANAELEEFQNAINDIYWEAFDELIARFDYISEEAQGLIDIMSELDMVSKLDNEDGWNADDVEWTKEGLATLGLHAQELERAEEKAKAYAVAIDELTAEYKAGHYSESEYYEKLNELTQGQYDAIKAAQEEKEAIVELQEARVDEIKKGIEKQIDAYDKLIKKQKEELDAEKDLHGFQKSVMDQQKSIAEIERQLAALAYDNSISAVARRKQLEAELAEAQYELQETYYERSVEDKQTALDKELETFTEEKEAEIEKWEEYLTNVESIVAESLGIVQENATAIGNTLTEKTQEYNLTVSDAILSPWKSGKLAIDEYTTKFGDSISATTKQLDSIRSKWQEIKQALAEANAEADKYYSKTAATAKGPSVATINQENKNYTQSTNTYTPASSSTSNNKTTNNTSNNTNQTKAAPSVGGTVVVKKTATNFSANSGNAGMASFVPGGSYTVYEVDGNQILIGRNGVYTGWVNKTDLQGYAKGSISIKEDQLAWLDELGEELQFVPGANGRLEYVKKGTGIVPADLTKRLIDLAMNPQEMLDRNRPQIAPSQSVINNNMEINVDASVGTLLHVDRIDGNNPDEVVKIVNKAWDKKMQGLNSAIRKFVR